MYVSFEGLEGQCFKILLRPGLASGQASDGWGKGWQWEEDDDEERHFIPAREIHKLYECESFAKMDRRQVCVWVSE